MLGWFLLYSCLKKERRVFQANKLFGSWMYFESASLNESIFAVTQTHRCESTVSETSTLHFWTIDYLTPQEKKTVLLLFLLSPIDFYMFLKIQNI